MNKRSIGLASAFRSITIIPVWGNESKCISTTLYWFSLVGLVLGYISYYVGLLFYNFSSALVGGSLVVITLAFLTRAFHLDGVCDTADGFGGAFEKERILAIMKDSTIGSFGAISVTLLLIAKVAAASALFEFGLAKYMVVSVMLARLMAVFQATLNRYAKDENSSAQRLVSKAKARHALVSSAMFLIFVLIFKLVSGIDLLILVGSSFLITGLIALISYRKIGGITGDLLGVTVEFNELVGFLVPLLFRNIV